IRQDIEKGEGVGVIDPHGDLVEHILTNVPQERIKDVILFEPFETARPFGLNMLEWDTPEQRDFAISEMITIFTHLFPPEIIGPMFEHYMRNAMLALAADRNNPGTIVEIPNMYTNERFAEEKIRKVNDPLVRNFWLKEWKQTTGQTRSDMLGYVVSKLGRFIENEMMRNILGQSQSSFNLEEIMNNKKIFLANLSKGLTGEVNSSLLGLIMVSKMQVAAFRRTIIPEDQRNDFYLYVDEFQNFTTDSVATILSEARKYRLNLILAHQYMPQLKEEIKNAVIGNVGTIASYRIGITDAEFLESQFSPEFSKFDLSNIDNFQYIVKMMLEGKISSPFKVKAVKPVQRDYGNTEAIKNMSRTKYGRPKVLVEEEITQKLKIDV
ncbi:MAG: ATP-binding protein, partial [Candidatus Nealsonbacteria bacterium]|nr:ATP-binding protein [Candidatus Nealsonbacteria bacterium]